MAEGKSNGHDSSRLDRLEQIVSGLAEWQGHLTETVDKLADSQQHLLYAQGVLHDEVLSLGRQLKELAQTTTESQAKTESMIRELREGQRTNEEQIHLLIKMMDEWIRRQPPPPVQ